MLFQSVVPSSASAYGIIPFVVILILSLLCSGLFMRYFWKSRERDRISAVTSTLGLWFALVTSFLLPLDVFLVSFMKRADGTFKDWATNETRISIGNGLSYSYYSLYSIILFFAFFLLPLVYFAYEEKDDEHEGLSKRCCRALKFALVFVFGAAVLLLVGAFIPYRQVSSDNKNETDWEVMQQIFDQMYSNRGLDAIYFVLNVLMLIGMFNLVLYTGIGVSSFPITCIRGWRSLTQEKEILADRKASLTAKMNSLRSKSKLSRRQQNELNELQEEEHLLSRVENQINTSSNGICAKLGPLPKVLYVLVGTIGVILGFLIWLALLLTNIDKLINSLGYQDGYLLAVKKIINPMDYIMVQSQKVFPIDYIFFFGIVAFLMCCTVGGIRDLGIWCFCVRVFKIRPHMTQPQALIILCDILLYTTLGMNVFMLAVMPQYTTFGSQHYVNGTTKEIVPCSHEASQDECTMTKASTFLLAFAIKAWVFGAIYYWLSWAFLIVVILSFIWAVVRKKFSYIDEAVERDDFDDTDDDVRPIVA